MQINSKNITANEKKIKKHTNKNSREQKAEWQKHVTYKVAEQM